MSKRPDFIIIGAMKCGTTAAQGMLQSHPNIWMPVGETHYFDRRGALRPFQDYLDIFPDDGRTVGEKSPRYIRMRKAISRIKEFVPEAQLLVFLRDPVMRFVSHWHHAKRRKWFSGSLEQLWRKGLGRRFRKRGYYAKQLTMLFEYFPRDQVHIAFNEDMRRDTVGTMRAVQEFLGVDPVELDNTPSAEYLAADIPLFSTMAAYYKPFNQALYRMLGYSQILEWSGMVR